MYCPFRPWPHSTTTLSFLCWGPARSFGWGRYGVITLQVSHLFIITTWWKIITALFFASLSEIAFPIFTVIWWKNTQSYFRTRDKDSPPSVLGGLDWFGPLYSQPVFGQQHFHIDLLHSLFLFSELINQVSRCSLDCISIFIIWHIVFVWMVKYDQKSQEDMGISQIRVWDALRPF